MNYVKISGLSYNSFSGFSDSRLFESFIIHFRQKVPLFRTHGFYDNFAYYIIENYEDRMIDDYKVDSRSEINFRTVTINWG